MFKSISALYGRGKERGLLSKQEIRTVKQAKCDNNFAYVSFYLLINDALNNPYFFFNCFNFEQASFPIYTGLVYIFRTVCLMELIERLFLTVHIHCKPRTDIMIEFDKA